MAQKKHRKKKSFLPVVGNIPARGNAPSVGAAPVARQWTFSFRFFRQIEHFGAGNADVPWFISLLEKLADLSAMKVDDLLSDPAMKLHWRLHEINWNPAPIRRNDLDWINAKYLDNATEYPIWQFQISKALGRVIGFWDERGIFNIVLLDMMHNMQPSQYADYKLRAAPIADGEFSIAIRAIEGRIANCGADCRCRGIYAEIQRTLTSRLDFTTMLVPMSDELFRRLTATVSSGLADCIEDVLQIGMDSLDKPE